MTDERELQEIFGRPRYGDLADIKIIRDHATGRSKCFAFVYYTTIKGAQRARNDLNGEEIRRKEIRVDYSFTKSNSRHDSPSRSQRDRGRGSPRRQSFGGYSKPNRCVGVFNLNRDTTEDKLRSYFKKFGRIDNVRIIVEHNTGRSKGFGFVYYEDKESAIDCCKKMNGAEIQGNTIRVDFSQTNAERESNSRYSRSRRDRSYSVERGR